MGVRGGPPRIRAATCPLLHMPVPPPADIPSPPPALASPGGLSQAPPDPAPTWKYLASWPLGLWACPPTPDHLPHPRPHRGPAGCSLATGRGNGGSRTRSNIERTLQTARDITVTPRRPQSSSGCCWQSKAPHGTAGALSPPSIHAEKLHSGQPLPRNPPRRPHLVQQPLWLKTSGKSRT